MTTAIDRLLENLDRLAQWAQFQDPNSTIWLHATEAKEAIRQLSRDRDALKLQNAIYEKSLTPITRDPSSPTGFAADRDAIRREAMEEAKQAAKLAIIGLEPPRRKWVDRERAMQAVAKAIRELADV